MGHPHDPIGHRHHNGVWITHSAVSGVNFWDDEADNGKDKVRGSIRHQKVLGYWDGDESAAMMTLNHWVAERDNRVLLIEKRYMEVRPAPDAQFMVAAGGQRVHALRRARPRRSSPAVRLDECAHGEDHRGASTVAGAS